MTNFSIENDVAAVVVILTVVSKYIVAVVSGPWLLVGGSALGGVGNDMKFPNKT